jgi:hypothetical protein
MSCSRIHALRGVPLLAGLLSSLAIAGSPPSAWASSHAEAPMISEDPQADNTDLYMFRSPEDPSKVVIISNYIPLEEPGSGPNFKHWSDNVLYEVKVDRNNDGVEDLAFQFQFNTKIRASGTFLNYLGPVTSLTTDGSTVDNGSNVNPNINRYQTFTLTMATPRPATSTGQGGGVFAFIGSADEQKSTAQQAVVQQTLAQNVIVPPPNVGETTTPNYAALADRAIHTVPGTGIRVFAGQRDDAFFIDLGGIFDLLQVRPFRTLSALPNSRVNRTTAADSLAGFNVHAIALEVPITMLTGTSTAPAADDPRRLIGIWSTASRRRTTVLRGTAPPTYEGDWVQVSRLGAPLVNELFIPIKDANGYTKDYWNAVQPSEDTRFVPRFQQPEATLRLAQLYPALRGVVPFVDRDATTITQSRTDLLGGVTPLLNFAPDELRLDTSLPAVAAGNRLGVIAGDLGGFPNGRRLADDVVDIYMRAAAGVLVPGTVPGANDSQVTRGEFLQSINFGDGVDANTDSPFLARFPFEGTPHDGLNPPHNNNKAQGTD